MHPQQQPQQPPWLAPLPPQQPPVDRQRRQRWTAGVAVLAALVIGGITGSLIGGSRAQQPAITAATPAVAAAPSPTVPAVPDPVCAEWSPAANAAAARQVDWASKFDPTLAAAEWTPEQRAVTERSIPLLREDADAMLRLGRKAENSLLADLLQAEGAYAAAFIDRLASGAYTPADYALWKTAIDLGVAARSVCKTVAAR
jgi:hypothetical protein